MSEIITTGQTRDLSAPAIRPLDQNPAAVYLASLQSDAGRRTQRQALARMAEILTAGGHADPFSFPWQALRYQHTAALRAQLMQAYKPATVNKFLSALRGVLKQAWTLELMTAEEYSRAANLKPAKGETLPAGRELDRGEIAALLRTCEKDTTPAGARDAAILAVMYTCGLRREEVTRLDLADYDPETGRLVIRGKGHKERTAYVTGGAEAALSDWLTVRGADPGPLFWPINKGGNMTARTMTTQAVYNLLEKRAAQAGLAAFSPHDLRRTFVSDLLDAGADIATVAKLAGHANVQTTARYDRRNEQAKRKAAGLLHIPYHKRTP